MNDKPPEYYPKDWNKSKCDEFDEICELYNIDRFYAAEMRTIICAPEKVLFVDNSGSMNNSLSETPLKCLQGHFVKRYDELVEFLKIAISLLSIDSAHGITLVFLNPPDPNSSQYIFHGIHSWKQAEPLLKFSPGGGTPLIARFQEQYERIKNNITEQGALFFIATDGEPSDQYDFYGAEVKKPGKYFCDLIKTRSCPNNFIVNILLCTDNDDVCRCYNRLDKEAVCVDVSDDYNSEKRQVEKIRKGKPFTFADYVVKAIVGGACKKFDMMDERQVCQIS